MASPLDMDIHGVDPEFLSKFEEEFKEYQDSAEKTKAITIE